jgi:hypothetical protein
MLVISLICPRHNDVARQDDLVGQELVNGFDRVGSPCIYYAVVFFNNYRIWFWYVLSYHQVIILFIYIDNTYLTLWYNTIMEQY